MKVDRIVELEADLEALYVERGELRAQRDIIAVKRGYDKMSQEEFQAAYDELDCYDEYESIDYELYTVERAIDEIEHTLYVERLGYDDNNNIEEEDSMDRNEVLVRRFFDILENGGNWTEMYLIRDLLMEEYINGAFSQVEILQIDDIIQEALERELEANEPVIEMYYLDDIVNNIYKAIERGDLDGAFALTNAYGDNAQSNPYIYYCVVRELERVTGENYIELCI